MTTKNKLVDIDLTEQGVFSWPNDEIKGWRNYRIEYGGCNRDCYYEGNMWLPPYVDSEIIGYKLFEILQDEYAYQELKNKIEFIHGRRIGSSSNWKTPKPPPEPRMKRWKRKTARWLRRTFLPMD